MDLPVILKILRITAPETTEIPDSENLLLDRNTCRLVASGFVRLLKISSKTAPRARTAVLKNIRSVTAPPPDHRSLDALIPLLLHHYSESANSLSQHVCEVNEIDLDAYLCSQMRNILLTPRVDTSNVNLLKALLNIDPGNTYIKAGLKKLLSTSVNGSEKRLLLQIWDNTIELSSDIIDLIATHLKFYIEKTLLDISTVVLPDKFKISEVLKLSHVANLIVKCSISPNCFQICCNVLNSLVIYSNFNENILCLVSTFIENVKLSSENFVTLYDHELQPLVMLINLDELIEKDIICNTVVEKLKHLKKQNLIMLMSHNCKYFDYFANKIGL